MSSARDIIRRATDLLQDPTSIRWPVDELVRWLNDAQIAIVKVRPDITATTTHMYLASGTRQVLSTSRFTSRVVNTPMKLLEVVRNVPVERSATSAVAFSPASYDASGERTIEYKSALVALPAIKTTSNRVITQVEQKVLDAGLPGWRGTLPAKEVLHYVFDERQKTAFDVYPCAESGVLVEVRYSAYPEAIQMPDVTTTQTQYTIITPAVYDANGILVTKEKVTTTYKDPSPAYSIPWMNVTTTAVGIPTEFSEELLNIVMYKAYSKDNEFAGNQQRAQNYLTAAMNSLGEGLKAALNIMPAADQISSK